MTNSLPDHYFTIESSGIAEFKDRGSRFIAYAFPVVTSVSFREQLKRLKLEHPKANHHCFAYRLGTAGMEFRASDDGEPSGTAGKPILGQIDSKKLTNTGVVVIRSFGGSLLGVPGLINAYKTATALVLQTIPAIQKQIQSCFIIEFDYTQMNEVMQLIRRYEGSVLRQQLNMFSIIDVNLPKNRVDDFIFQLNNMKNIHIRPGLKSME